MPELALSPFIVSRKEQFGGSCRKYCGLYSEGFEGHLKEAVHQGIGGGGWIVDGRGECVGAVQHNTYFR